VPNQMPVNHQKPIEDADLWDIISWEHVCNLTKEDTGDPRDGGGSNLIPAMATRLIAAAGEMERADERLFHTIASAWVGFGSDVTRRQKASRLAFAFGADQIRLIEYLAFKWGLFKRSC
jgi:hypothetical protein